MKDQSLSFYQTIGARIREVRITRGMSQADLAEKAHLSLPVISSIENARSKTWLITFVRVIEALEVSPDDILRLNTPAATASLSAEVARIFAGCTASEMETILTIAKQVRQGFDNQKKELLD